MVALTTISKILVKVIYHFLSPSFLSLSASLLSFSAMFPPSSFPSLFSPSSFPFPSSLPSSLPSLSGKLDQLKLLQIYVSRFPTFPFSFSFPSLFCLRYPSFPRRLSFQSPLPSFVGSYFYQKDMKISNIFHCLSIKGGAGVPVPPKAHFIIIRWI